MPSIKRLIPILLVVTMLTGCSLKVKEKDVGDTGSTEDYWSDVEAFGGNEDIVTSIDDYVNNSTDTENNSVIEIINDLPEDVVEEPSKSDEPLTLGDLTIPSSMKHDSSSSEKEEIKATATAPAECVHKWEKEERTEAVKCNEEYKEIYVCSLCGKTKTQTMLAADHTYEITKVEPTCSTGGYTLSKCTKCGNTEKSDVTGSLGHKEATKVASEPSCDIPGIQATYCTECNKILKYSAITALTHNWEKTTEGKPCEAGAQNIYTCKNCKGTKTEPLTGAHKLGDWSVSTKATCTKEGERSRTCSVCGYKETEKVGVTDHTLSSWKTVTEASCKSSGSKQRTCTSCNQIIDTETIPKLSHSLEWVTTKEATCTAEGKMENTCSKCGTVTETSTLAALGHSYTITGTKDPTCEIAGYKTYACSNCKDTYEEPIGALGHTYGADGACIRCKAVKSEE